MFTKAYLDLTDEILPFFVREGKGDSPDQAEAARSKGRVSEEIVRLIWMEQPWYPGSVRDVRGRPVEIISPGWLNGGPGPDFRNALFRYDGGDAERGDVELHVRSTDWDRHKHGKDAAYNGVRLHVMMFCDSLSRKPTMRQDGKPVIDIELSQVCPGALEKARSGLLAPSAGEREDPGRRVSGRCGEALRLLGPERVEKILNAAGEGRCELKSRRYLAPIRNGEGERELYLGIVESFGYSAFRDRFRRVAAAAPPEVLRLVVAGARRQERPVVLQAALFGVSGLLPGPAFELASPDEESEKYAGRLWTFWKEIAGRCCLEADPLREGWKLAGTRPANYPARRLAGLAHFLAAHVDTGLETLFLRILEDFPLDGGKGDRRRWLKRIALLFFSPLDYWARRYTWGGKKLSRPVALIGQDKVGLMFVNVIIPFFLARARVFENQDDEEKIRIIYHSMPVSEDNSVTRLMTGLVFKNVMPEGSSRSVAHTQGLTQIYSDFCRAGAPGCSSCGFGSYLERLSVSDACEKGGR